MINHAHPQFIDTYPFSHTCAQTRFEKAGQRGLLKVKARRKNAFNQRFVALSSQAANALALERKERRRIVTSKVVEFPVAQTVAA